MSRPLPSWLRVAFGLLLVMQVVLPYRAVLPPPAALADSAAAPALAAAPVLAPAALSSAAPNLDLSLDLSLTAEPTMVEPGDVVTYTATIANAGDTPLTAVVLTDTLPAGLVYVAGSAVGFDYDPDAQQLTWAVGTLAPGAILTGSFQARVQGVALGETLVNEVIATAAELTQPVTAQAAITVKLPAAARAWITPAGGVLVGREGRVLLVFAAGSVTAAVEAAITAAPADVIAPSHLLEAFQLSATDAAGRGVTRFARPVTVVLNLAGYAEQLRTRQGSPSLYTLDETSGQWQVVPTAVDWGRNTATATVEHFSVYAAGTSSALSYGAQHLPTVHGFTSDEWSGNSSVSYPLALPPGPSTGSGGGLGLNLSLSYSSEGVNSIRQGPSYYNGVNYDQQNGQAFNRQASFVGWGWSLNGLGQVTVNLASNPPKAYLGYAGGGFDLKYDATNGWQTEPQSFVRIEHAGVAWSTDPWYVWAPDGTKYTFGSAGFSNGVAWVRNTGSCSQQTREAHLTEVLDPHGNKVSLTYATETDKNIICGGTTQNYVRAIRPTRIEYFAATEPLATVRVDFAYVTRNDTGVPGRDDLYVEAFYSDWRLQTVTVKVRNGTPADAFATVRSYALSQDYLWQDQAAGKGLLRLTGITEQGRDGGALPAWSFTYTTFNGWLNHTLLATANNGQGGQVAYAYANVSNIWMEGCGENTSRYRVSQIDAADGLGSQAANVTRTVYDHQNPWARTGAGAPACPDFEFGGYTFVRSELQDGAASRYRVVDTYYHQRTGNELDPRKGKAYLSVTSSQPGSGELARGATTWITSTVKAATWVAKADETNTLGGSAQKTTYAYDTARQNGAQYGNVTHVREYSDSGATLYRTRERWYYPNNVAGSTYIVNRVAQEKLWQGNVGGNCQAHTRYIYDNPQNGWMAAPTRGDLVKQRQETSICDDTGTDAGWLTAFYGYDGWGNRIAVTDTLTHTTLTAYDTSGNWPKLYAYPISETLPAVNGLSLTTVYAWDKVLGQVTSVTDPNNVVTSYVYDEFGRQLKLIKPGDDTTNPTVKLSYNNYAGTTAPYWVKQEQKESGAAYLESRTYYDGLGRVVQTQAEAETSSQSIIASSRYNPLGVMQATAPYTYTQGGLGVGGNYRTPDWNQPGASTAYDALGRRVQVIQPDGSQLNTSYQDRTTTAFDPLNRKTVNTTDTFGRLATVQQYLGTGATGDPYSLYGTTTYAYDVADRLTGVTGPDGAVTALVYDLAGRKLKMHDPDMSGSTDVNNAAYWWTYAYDAAGNLLRQTDARNQRSCFYYDALDRLKGRPTRRAARPVPRIRATPGMPSNTTTTRTRTATPSATARAGAR